MITFRVAKERHGWSVKMDKHMTTPFRLRELAVREAESLASSLRNHGQRAEIIIDDDPRFEKPPEMAVVAATLQHT